MSGSEKAARAFTFTPYARNQDLIFGFADARLLSGSGCEPWVMLPLSAWMTELEAELARRGLLEEAERVYRSLLGAHRRVRAGERVAAIDCTYQKGEGKRE